MNDQIAGVLEPVRRRQLVQQVLRTAAQGLFVGVIAALVLGLWRFRLGTPAPFAVGTRLALALLFAGPALGALWALFRGRSTLLAASAADERYGLKDRTVSAVEFIHRDQPSPLHRLQVADAQRHLAAVDPRQVAPFMLPRLVPYAALLMIPALALLFWSRPTPVQAMPLAPLENVLDAADEAAEDLEDLELAANRENAPELKKLVQKLGETVQAMKLPGVDVKEALAKLSEMQAAVAAEQAQYNVGVVDAQMQNLGEAMASTQALDGAGQALQNGKYDQAAQQLEKLEPKFDAKEAKTLKEKLAQAAKQMEDAGLTDLSTATTELAEALDEDGAAASACKKLGNLARAQGRRKRIKDLLSTQVAKLGQCKSDCDKNSTAKLRMKKKSEKPSHNWGMSTSGNVDGERTTLGAGRKREQVTGEMGEGASETETTHLPEGRQMASRTYREAYQKYRRMTEAALDSEPLPLGHRETIRKYFELIRPQNDEPDAAPASR